jgi:hypothetical protein
MVEEGADAEAALAEDSGGTLAVAGARVNEEIENLKSEKQQLMERLADPEICTDPNDPTEICTDPNDPTAGAALEDCAKRVAQALLKIQQDTATARTDFMEAHPDCTETHRKKLHLKFAHEWGTDQKFNLVVADNLPLENQKTKIERMMQEHADVQARAVGVDASLRAALANASHIALDAAAAQEPSRSRS